MRLGAFFFEIMPLAGFFIGFHYYGLLIPRPSYRWDWPGWFWGWRGGAPAMSRRFHCFL